MKMPSKGFDKPKFSFQNGLQGFSWKMQQYTKPDIMKVVELCIDMK